MDKSLPTAAPQVAWHSLTPEDSLQRLQSDSGGLTAAEAEARRTRFGPNRLPRRAATTVLVLYLHQFKSPLVYLLLAATVVSLVIGDWTDAVFIFAVLQINAVIGVLQEWKAEHSAAALDQMLETAVVALRDGRAQQLPTTDLVPGDVVLLASGSMVPADLRLLEQQELLLDESLLTGESLSVEKDAGVLLTEATPLAERRNLLFAGSVILAGRACAAVVATGAETQIGRIAEALAAPDVALPPLIRRLEKFSRTIGIATVAAICVIAAVHGATSSCGPYRRSKGSAPAP
jgi:magnesium-transporting ATPase (P-type)